MRRLALALLCAGVACIGVTAAAAGTATAPAPAAATDISSQTGERARTRITVRPGRKLVRECDFRLVREARESGVYVVPRQRCWWARR